ncbi:hypothetical protein K5549_017395, partial [Capra hircus]
LISALLRTKWMLCLKFYYEHIHSDQWESLGIVGFHGDPNFLNKTLKHLKRSTVVKYCH